MKKKKLYWIISSSLFIIIILGALEFFGIIWHNELFTINYTVKGLDISHYQNKVNWSKISKNYDFVFLKATEGKDYVDPTFIDNWNSARKNGFLIGAYHFFTTSSSGKQQANNFINTVPELKASLPPVIDIEISINKDKEAVRKQLAVMIDMLSAKYDKTPILYVTYDTYNAFIKEYFSECDIWIRDILKPPKLKDKREWTFWQYCNRGRIKGIDTYVDINVFNGTRDDLIRMSESKGN